VSDTPKAAIIGVGNPILSDDQVGIIVARKIHESIKGRPNVALIEAPVGGLDLLDTLLDYDDAIVIDAVQTEGGKAGSCYRFDFRSLDSGAALPSMTHQVGLLEGIMLLRRLGLRAPEGLRVYAVEVADPYTFGVEMTAPVREAVPRIVDEIVATEFGARQ